MLDLALLTGLVLIVAIGLYGVTVLVYGHDSPGRNGPPQRDTGATWSQLGHVPAAGSTCRRQWTVHIYIATS